MGAKVLATTSKWGNLIRDYLFTHINTKSMKRRRFITRTGQFALGASLLPLAACGSDTSKEEGNAKAEAEMKTAMEIRSYFLKFPWHNGPYTRP